MKSSTVTDMSEVRSYPVLMTTEQAARLTGTSDKYIRDCLARGQIKGAKIGGRWFINRDEFLSQLGLCEVRTYA